MSNTLNAIIKLRKKNLNDYPDNFIPADGEVCLIDDDLNGLRIKVGNGMSAFKNLPFLEADSSTIGMVKLYNSAGEHTDGTMTQKAISDLAYSAIMNWGQLGQQN